MTDRPILRLPDPRPARRQTGSPSFIPKPKGGGGGRQGARFQRTFDDLEAALGRGNAAIELRRDPGGIAPERALVFVTAAPISNFARAAREVGLEVLAELDLDEDYAFPEDFELEDDRGLQPTLYATMPTLEVFDRLLGLWHACQRGEKAPYSAAPWWDLFDTLAELRPWGPEDRFSPDNRIALENRLPFDDAAEVAIELEIWPTRNARKRTAWRRETEARIEALGGRVLDTSSITESGFIYEAILAGLSAGAIRQMIDNPGALNGLASLDGLQFILPQTIAQTAPVDDDDEGDEGETDRTGGFDQEAPYRALLLDGTPIAAHEALDGGVAIEDIHDLVRLSQVRNRRHATSMASLILRGDLEAEGDPLTDSRLITIPLLVDSETDAKSPDNRLFVDLVHVALMRAFRGDDPVAPDAFVVNFSIGIYGAHYAGRVSALARLLDWWAAEEGILFVVSAGNVGQDLTIADMTAVEFEDASLEDRQEAIRAANRFARFDRTLLAPAEALNALSVGAASIDRAPPIGPAPANALDVHATDEITPALSSALGLGPFRAIKPDLLGCGGIHEVRAVAAGEDTRLRVVNNTRRTGLHVASAQGGNRACRRARGTSCATALTTRSLLQAAEALTGEEGSFPGVELPREALALLTRALAVNAAHWPDSAKAMYRSEMARLGSHSHVRAKEEVARHYGHGYLDPALMLGAPEAGVTLIGLGAVRKDRARIFEMPLPPSLSGDAIHRWMQVTLTWFSPVDPSRARYRLAALDAIAADADELADYEEDEGWNLSMKSDLLAKSLLQKGTVWSRRLVHNRVRTPEFEEGAVIPIRVQCKDASGGGLDQDFDIHFAIAVTLQVAATVAYDVHEEVREQLQIRLSGAETP